MKLGLIILSCIGLLISSVFGQNPSGARSGGRTQNTQARGQVQNAPQAGGSSNPMMNGPPTSQTLNTRPSGQQNVNLQRTQATQGGSSSSSGRSRRGRGQGGGQAKDTTGKAPDASAAASSSDKPSTSADASPSSSPPSSSAPSGSSAPPPAAGTGGDDKAAMKTAVEDAAKDAVSKSKNTPKEKLKCTVEEQKFPIVTGTSVIAVKYQDGVMMAADCLASYGSLARFRDVQRLTSLGTNTLMGTSGDISDLQATIKMLKEYENQEICYDDGHQMTPSQWHTALAAQMYQRRTDMDPLWNSHIIAGVEPKTGQVFLGYADLLGTTYQSDSIATGYGAYLAQPLLRKAVEGRQVPMTEAEAAALLESCMRVLFYRDARSADKVQYAKVTAAGVTISAPVQLTTDWSIGKRTY